jgi:Mg2+-importing ATPase
MSRRKVIVKRLNAIQNFGAMDVLCTDKTGTLTQDNIILEHHLDVSGHESDRVLTLAWLNSSSQSGAQPDGPGGAALWRGRIAPATKERFVKLMNCRLILYAAGFRFRWKMFATATKA